MVQYTVYFFGARAPSTASRIPTLLFPLRRKVRRIRLCGMGALPFEPDPSAEKVRQALQQKQKGNPLSYFRLQHALSAKSAPAIAEVLTGLTHLAASLHTDTTYSADLRVLISSALSIDLKACTVPTDGNSYPALDALHLFVVNLISADAGFVEPVLQMFAKNAFTLPVDGRGPVVNLTYAAITSILDAYPRADALLAEVLCTRYPHPVRPAQDHQAYLRSVLHVSRNCRSVGLCRSIIATVFEKLGAIEALVPADMFCNTLASPGKDREEGAGHILSREAEKIEIVLQELFRHIDLASKNSAVDYAGAHLEHIVSAYESSIVPVEGTRFAPYVLLYATSIGGPNAVWAVIQQLRQSFLDPSMSQRLREKFLQHSSVLVIRSKAAKDEQVLNWVSSVAGWLNRYIDVHERRRSFGGVDVDTDVHHLFYCACCALMSTVSKRIEAITSLSATNNDLLDRIRLYRIMSCGMNPMLVIPNDIVTEFVQVVQKSCGMDFSDILEENTRKYTPSRTKYGSRNQFIYTVRCPDLELSNAREKLQEYVNFDSVENDIADWGENMEISTPVSRTKPISFKLANVTPSNIIRSTGLARLD